MGRESAVMDANRRWWTRISGDGLRIGGDGPQVRVPSRL